MSIEIPTDPVQDLIDMATFWRREIHMRLLRSISPRKLQRMAERKTGKRLVV